MPRGQYDRSHLKSKRAAAKAVKAAATATVAAGIAIQKSTEVPARPEGFRPPAGYGDMDQLRVHLLTLTQTRGTLCTNQVAHNDSLIAQIDGEISNVIRSMASWRESLFPIAVKEVVEVAKVAPKAPAPAPAPVTAPIGVIPPAPLPFTPQAVQEVLKSAGQA